MQSHDITSGVCVIYVSNVSIVLFPNCSQNKLSYSLRQWPRLGNRVYTHKSQGEESCLKPLKNLHVFGPSKLFGFMVNRIGLSRKIWAFREEDVHVFASRKVIAFHFLKYSESYERRLRHSQDSFSRCEFPSVKSMFHVCIESHDPSERNWNPL